MKKWVTFTLTETGVKELTKLQCCTKSSWPLSNNGTWEPRWRKKETTPFIKPVLSIRPIQICKRPMSACLGAFKMRVIQLDQTLNRWERNIKLQKIPGRFLKRIMATKIQIKLMRKEWTNIQVHNKPRCTLPWEAMASLSTNILEVLVKTRLKIKSMILLLWSSERKKWKERFSYVIRKIMEELIDIRLLIWLWINKKAVRRLQDFIKNSRFTDQEVLQLQM